MQSGIMRQSDDHGPLFDTSRAAHQSLAPRTVVALQQRVLAAIEAAGSNGLTTDEVEAITGLSHQTASARVYELRGAGRIRRTELRRRTRSGRYAYVHVAP